MFFSLPELTYIHIANACDRKFLKDPDGKVYVTKRKESLSEEQRNIENILEGTVVNEEHWTTSLDGIPMHDYSLGCRELFQKSRRKTASNGRIVVFQNPEI